MRLLILLVLLLLLLTVLGAALVVQRAGRRRDLRAGWQLDVVAGPGETVVGVRRGQEPPQPVARIAADDPAYEERLIEAEDRALARAAALNATRAR